MNKRKRMKTIRVAVPESVYGDFAKGHVSRGSLHIDENGEFFFHQAQFGFAQTHGAEKEAPAHLPGLPRGNARHVGQNLSRGGRAGTDGRCVLRVLRPVSLWRDDGYVFHDVKPA